MGDILEVDDLHVHYETRRAPVRAVDGVSFGLRAGERFGLAGESGSGKSTVAMAIMGLLRPPARIVAGRVQLGGKDLLGLSDEQLRQTRLADIALVPQGAMNSLNPVRRVRDHFRDSIRAHRAASDREVHERSVQLLRMVGLRERILGLYPHELSGGMKQRVCIALSISLTPRVIIADEPTSALDVVVQRQVMETLRTVQERLGAAVLLIGHDMGLLAQFVERLGVMYRGRLVEVGPVRDVFREPLHRYTRMLIRSLPTLDEKKLVRADAESRNGRAAIASGPPVPLAEARPGHWVAMEEGGDG
jgi:ABC-type dipeptide/oligopeptide/nickel transport system ATPase component